MKQLLLGAGSDLRKKLGLAGEKVEWDDLTTLDYNVDHKPDVCWDLEIIPYPFMENEFDEIHAYEVLEHTGSQGDWQFFFDQFTELHRILKPGGRLYATVPRWDSLWAWGDPSHKRVLNEGSLTFLDQQSYVDQVGKTPLSDFRFCYKANLKTIHAQYTKEHFIFVLEAIK